MRICHGLAGEVVQVDSEYRKPLDLVRQHARERWSLQLEDLIVLTSNGNVLSAESREEEVEEVYFFTRQCLETQVEVIPDRLDPADPSLAAFGGVEELDDVVGQRCEDVIDPVFEAFRSNIAEARARILESRPVVALAQRCEERAQAQTRAARAVLENLNSHRTACGRSISLLVQKSNRVQAKLSDCLEKVEASMKALESVALHTALQSEGRQCLADVVPRDRILRFTESLEAEAAQLVQRLEKLQRQDSQLEGMCEQVAERVEQLIREDAVGAEAQQIHEEQVCAQRELPKLRALVPSAGAAPAMVLEDEKRSALLRDRVTSACAKLLRAMEQLQSCWDRQHQMFVQRLREVAYVQSKVRYVERQAALLEEEVNAQSSKAQQLARLQKMPKAYYSALREVGLRRQFRERYVAQAEKARTTLSRMVEAENSRRRGFLQKHSCYLPVDLVQGLGAFAPASTVEVPDFDSQLPDIALASLEADKDVPGPTTSVCSTSSLRATVNVSNVSSSGEAAAAQGSEAAEAKPAAKEATAERIAELEARNKALEEQLEHMRQEQATRAS
mmetsp:Transcript_26792/g.63806  ORF Transcript_26792/g.63806 Transcript_26792/m.63806 type:complete len:561 (-) Transcript_26792:140-1822(-)